MTLKPTLRPATPADLGAIEALLTRNALPLDGVREALPGFIDRKSTRLNSSHT